MTKPPKPDPDDIEAFEQAIKGSKPLVQDKIRLSPPRSKQKVIKKVPPPEDSLHLEESDENITVQGEEFISFKQSSISNKTLRKLRKGQYNVDAMLDLHGLSIEKARSAVDHFLQECCQRGVRIALIIHGKGSHSQMPILKNKLNQWLRNVSVVLAFCSALPTHGSRGAIYVLLKHLNDEENSA